MNQEDKIKLNQFYDGLLENYGDVYGHLESLSQNAYESNKDFLMNLIRENENTAFGIKYDFKNIHSVKDYQEKVPVSDYDDYIDFLIPMAYQGVEDLLTAYEVKHYNKSSGTLGNPKKIPISEKAQKINTFYSLPFLLNLMEREIGSDWKNGKTFLIAQYKVSDLPSGATYGALSAKIALNLKDYFNLFSTSPVDVLVPEDEMDTHYLHSLYALREKDVTIISPGYFSYLLEILRYIEINHKMLIKDIRKGTINKSINMSEDLREKLEKDMNPMTERADELEEIFNEGVNQNFIKKVWPNMQAFEGVGTATFETYVEKIKEKYSGDSIPFLYFGLQASEGLVSTPITLNNKSSVLAPDSLFFEFRPIEQEGYDNLLTIDQLEIGKDYEIILTNLSGFYRYKIKDVIRVTGMYNTLPEIVFLYRINQVVNLTGEKTTEIAINESVKLAEDKVGFDCVDFTVFPDVDATPMNYNFLVELGLSDEKFDLAEIRDEIERNLCKANPSFAKKLHDGIFGKTKLEVLEPETFMLYRDLMAVKGVSMAQMKPPRVIVNEFQRKFFYALIDYRVSNDYN